MKFALEHQNPLATGAVLGDGDALPANAYSLVQVSNPNVLLWALKPAEEGIRNGIIARLWNVSGAPQRFSLSVESGVARAQQTTHIETDLGKAAVVSGMLSGSTAASQLLTFRLLVKPGATERPRPE